MYRFGQAGAIADEICGTVCFKRRNDVDKMVGSDIPFGKRRLRRANIHAAVNQCGIKADDFYRQEFGQAQSQIGFAACRRAEDGETVYSAALAGIALIIIVTGEMLIKRLVGEKKAA